MKYKVGDKVWARNGWRVYKGKILEKFGDNTYVVKLFMERAIFYEDELAKRGGKE